VLPIGAAQAGPTADKLKSLGSNVAVPGDTPLKNDASGKLKGNPTGPIDGGSDRPPCDIEIDDQLLLGAKKVPLLNLLVETGGSPKPAMQLQKPEVPDVETETAEAEKNLD